MPAGRIVIDERAQALRRSLSATTWVVLEQVALDARQADSGALVAATSARRVAEVLRIDAGTAAAALRQLRRRGLVTLGQGRGSAARFGLAGYVLDAVPGLAVLAPRAEIPHTAEPDTAEPDTAEPDTAGPHKIEASPFTPPTAEPRVANVGKADAAVAVSRGSARAAGAAEAPAAPGQPVSSPARRAGEPDHPALDLGLENR
jgi:hypothetical protein